MKKIPTIFERDWDGTIGPPGRHVLSTPHPDCDWVFAGEGEATRKMDGTACLIRLDGIRAVLYKRLALRPHKKTGQMPDAPWGFEEIDRDDETGQILGWAPVGIGPEDKWHLEALDLLSDEQQGIRPGTYELIGPSVNGNPEGCPANTLVFHGDLSWNEGDVPTAYEELKEWLSYRDIEGIVWHHPDGRMAKIKKRDFGLLRVQPLASPPEPARANPDVQPFGHFPQP